MFTKYDDDKVRLNLIDPHFIEKIAKCLEFGARKYTKDNWKLGDKDRYINAAYRHLLEQMKGNNVDTESDTEHMIAVAVNCMFYVYLNNKDD